MREREHSVVKRFQLKNRLRKMGQQRIASQSEGENGVQLNEVIWQLLNNTSEFKLNIVEEQVVCV